MELNSNKDSSGAAGDEDTKAATGVEILTRIHVGGLGETVNGDDLRRLFHSLGAVEAVEIIRTKGRSFAYVNFRPSPPQDKPLSKLFSTYNGCLWKGGKLRLERAKEHYLVRLNREWAEDAEQTNHETKADFHPAKAMLPTPIPEKNDLEKKFLRIYFPRLRTVKSVPLSGTGKHKYSFQHVEVPSLPVNFCDCEEHCPAFTLSEKLEKQRCDVGAERGGMDGEEIRIMSMVMNKLLERENDDDDNYMESVDDIKSVEVETESASEEDDLIMNVMRVKKGKNSVGSKELQTTMGKQDVGSNQTSPFLEEQTQMETEPDAYEVESMSDEDDLVMNIVTKKRKSLSGSKEQQMILGKQDFGLKQTTSIEEPTCDSLKKHKKKITPDMRNSVGSPGNDHNSPMSRVPGNKKNLQMHPEFSGSQTVVVGTGIEHSSSNKSWSQKSSWKDLVGVKSNSNFNLSSGLAIREEQQSACHHVALPLSNPIIVKPNTQHLETKGSMEVELTKAEDLQGAVEDRHTNKSTISRHAGRGAKAEDLQRAVEDQHTHKSTISRHAGRGASWWQKSAWTQLVGENNCSFNTSQILPSFFQKPVTVDTNTMNMDMANLAENEQDIVEQVTTLPAGEGNSSTFGKGRNEGLQCIGKVNQDATGKETGAIPIVDGKRRSVLTKAIASEGGEVRPFVRSSSSLREWKKLKDDLSRLRKRKHSGK